MMKIFGRGCLALCILLMAACAAPSPTAVSTPLPDLAQLGKIRVAVATADSARDIPLLMALDLLVEQGYQVERIDFADTDLTLEALAQGDADIASSSAGISWTAIAKGAKFISVVSRTKYSFGVVTRKDIATCADLNGQAVATRSTTGINQAMFNNYIAENCPEVKSEPLIIGGSEVRRAALLSGEINVALLEPDDLLELEAQSPGDFHMLVNLGDKYPDLFFNVINVNQAWADGHAELVQAFIRALLLSSRSLKDDPKLLQSNLEKYLGYESDQAEKVAAIYLNPGAWDDNGAMTPESVQKNIEFLESVEAIPPGMKPDQVANLSYLNAVLAEIGRQ